MRRSGFTLVELLVVVGIIALLITILLPSLSRARESAKFVACRSNLQQIANGLRMYANDNKDHWPDPAAVGDPATAVAAAYFRRGVNWPDETNPAVKETLGLPNVFYNQGYIKSKDVWICPAATELNRSYGNSYVIMVSKSSKAPFATAGYTSKQRNTEDAKGTFYVYDNYLYKTPQETNKPVGTGVAATTFSSTQWVYPHRYLVPVGYSRTTTGQGRQGAVNCLYLDGTVGIVVYVDKGSSTTTIKIRGE